MACHRKGHFLEEPDNTGPPPPAAAGRMPSLRVTCCGIFIFMKCFQAVASDTTSTTVAPTSDPVCGPTVFTAISGEITSPYFPADYLNAVHCRFAIKRSYREPTLLRSTNFYLGTSDYCINNYVRVYPGRIPPHNVHNYCGSETIHQVFNSSLITVEFRSDGSMTGCGFRILFSGMGNLSTSPSPVNDPEAHSSSTTTSPINSTTIRTSNASPTPLRSSTFSLEYHELCGYDYVKIYTGSSPGISSDPVGVYCGTQAINRVLHGRYITVEFRSDRSVTSGGFQLMFGETHSSTTTTSITASTTTPTSSASCGLTEFYQNSGVIRSPYYPNNYHINTRCIYTIQRPRPGPTMIHSTHFQLEQEDDCNFDYLRIYAGPLSSHPVASFCGNDIINLQVDSSYITMKFLSDVSHTFSGFEIRFGDVNVNTITTTATPTTTNENTICGRTSFSENSGVIYSPNYPSHYPNNVHCIYHIHRYSSAPTLLRSLNFNLENTPTCAYDYVKIYANYHASLNPIGVYCGESINRVVNHSYITVEFRSDGTITGTGFELAFGDANMTVSTTTPATSTIDGQSAGCGRTMFRENSGFINSPNFPGLYPDNTYCIYTIYRYSSAPTLLRSYAFHLEDSISCNSDYVKIYTGPSPGITSVPVGVYCGTQTIKLVLHGRYITVEFRSDYLGAHDGFHLLFGDVNARSTTTASTTTRTATFITTATTGTTTTTTWGCGGTWQAPSGVITSPNYPGDYGDDNNCVYVIYVYNSGHVTLRFDHFDLESDSNCQYDSLKLINGDLRSGRVFQTLCGSHSGEVYRMSNYVTLQFMSEANITESGFHITYTASRTTTSSPPSGCGGTYRAPWGEITSPNYPNYYGGDLDCVYVIRLEYVVRIYLNIEELDLGFVSSCYRDCLHIIEGDLHTGKIIHTLCGLPNRNTRYMLPSHITLHLVSCWVGRFRIFYIVSETTTLMPGPESLVRVGICQNSHDNMYMCSDGSGCFNPSRWCDGRIDCNDGSDENAYVCGNRPTDGSSDSVTVPLAVVSSLVFVVVMIAVIVGAVIVRRKRGGRRPEPTASFSNPLAQNSVDVPTEDNWSNPPPYVAAPYVNATVNAQPCAPQPPTMIVEDPNGGYINPLYALSVQTENNDSNFIATTSTAGTTGGNAGSGITVGTAVDGTVGGTVSGGTPGDAGGAVAANTAVGGTSGSNVSGGTGDGGIKPSPASEDGQAQPVLDNCPAPARTDDAIVARTDDAIVARTDDAIVARTDDAVVARTDDAIVARTDDAVVARTDDAVFANTAEVGEEARGQDSAA